MRVFSSNTQISTHALREEGDSQASFSGLTSTRFLPTPSARRATDSRPARIQGKTAFLPTPSARRATPALACGFLTTRRYFYPRPPRGGRPTHNTQHTTSNDAISTHALREEGDGKTLCRLLVASYFYPRPPRGGRREADLHTTAVTPFLPTPSARRATQAASAWLHPWPDFYPRPPRGGRRNSQCPEIHQFCYFYPRPPRGGRQI